MNHLPVAIPDDHDHAAAEHDVILADCLKREVVGFPGGDDLDPGLSRDLLLLRGDGVVLQKPHLERASIAAVVEPELVAPRQKLVVRGAGDVPPQRVRENCGAGTVCGRFGSGELTGLSGRSGGDGEEERGGAQRPVHERSPRRETASARYRPV